MPNIGIRRKGTCYIFNHLQLVHNIIVLLKIIQESARSIDLFLQLIILHRYKAFIGTPALIFEMLIKWISCQQLEIRLIIKSFHPIRQAEKINISLQLITQAPKPNSKKIEIFHKLIGKRRHRPTILLKLSPTLIILLQLSLLLLQLRNLLNIVNQTKNPKNRVQ